MTVDRRKVRSIFLAAIEDHTPAEWPEFLQCECGDDSQLRNRVEILLRAHQEADSLLDPPAAESQATIAYQSTTEPDSTIGPYKLLQLIGEGGMGTVYMAEQTEPVKRKVALKLIKAGMDSRQVISRFEAERQALALMDHPHIAKVLDAGTTGSGLPYFVMDLVKGVPITKYCDEHHLTPRQRLELFIPVCQAVQHAHQKGIIHRDLKPSNVLVALYDGKPVPKVIDFGVAKATGQSLTDKTLVTGLGALVGTPEYMSPEQAEVNQLDIDTRSDIYSLGVLLYELLAGSPPFTRKDLEKAGMLEMLRLIREQEPSKPSTKLSTADGLPTLAANRGTEPARLTRLVRGELDWIVMKALEKDRNRRYETASGFALDIQRYLADEPVQACPPSAAYRLRKFARRNKAALAMTAVVALALLVGTAVSTWQAVRARRAEVNATKQRNDAQVQRRFARQAVDKMFTQVAEKWLSRNTSLEPVQKKILMDALQIYEELAKEDGADPTLQLERGNAYRRIGQIYDKLGNAPESERAFRKAQEILGTFVEQHPSEPDARAALGSAWHQFAFALHYSARMEDALEAYRQALRHRERLAADYPGVPQYTREMAVSLGGVANMLDSVGSLPEAATAYARAIHLMEGLPRKVADDADCRFELGLLYSEFSYASDQQGSARGSHPMFYRGKAIYEQLVREFPRDPTYREELAYDLSVEASLLADRPDEQEKVLRRSLAINLQLAQESPTVPHYQGSLCGRYYEVGRLMLDTGRRAEAEELFKKSARMAEQMLSDFPDWRPASFDGNFFGCHLALQRLLLQDGRPKEAEAIYLRALEVYAQLKPRWMESPSNRWFLAESRWDLAELACQYGRREEAAQFSGEALSLYEQSAAELPRKLEWQTTLVARKAELGNVSTCGEPAKETNRPFEEIDAYREVVAAAETLVTDFPDNPYYREQFGHCCRLLAASLSRAGRLQEAVDSFRRALPPFEKLAADFPAASKHRHFLADTHRQLGRLLAGNHRSDEAEAEFRRAIATYEKCLAELGNRLVEVREWMASYTSLAGFLKAKGREEEAAKIYEQLLQALGRLASHYPAEPRIVNALATAHQEVGAFEQQRGRIDRAEQSYQRALDLWTKLTSGLPGKAEYRVHAATLLMTHLAPMLDASGRAADAEQAFQRGVVECNKLAADFPAVPEYRHQRVDLLLHRGNSLHFTRARTREAEQPYRDALAEAERLVAGFPDVLRYRMQLMDCRRFTALILADTGRPQEAEAFARQALDLATKLADESPAYPGVKAKLARVHWILGKAFAGSAHAEDAEKAFRQAVTLLETLAADSPSDRRELALVRRDLALLLATDRNRLIEAETCYRLAIQLLEKVVADVPGEPFYRHELATCYCELYVILAAKSQLQDADQAFNQCLDIRKKLAADFPAVPDHRLQLADLLITKGRSRQAEEPFRQALTVYMQLAQDEPKNLDYRLRLSRSYNELAGMFARQGKHAEGALEWDKAAAEYSKAIDLKPNAWEAWSGRAFVHFGRQQWEAAIADFSKAIELAPLEHTNWWHRGHCYLNLAQWDKSAANFGTVVDRWPDGGEGWYLRGVALAQLNQPENAVADLRQAIANGFRNVEWMKNDSRLDPLRTREDFGKLLKELEQKEKSQSK